MYGLLSLLQHWEKLITGWAKKPKGRRYEHAVNIIHSPLKGDWKTLLLVTGGFPAYDAWLLSIGDRASWREVSVMKNSNAHITQMMENTCILRKAS